MAQLEVLALDANKNLVALQKHMEKMKRDGHRINIAEWHQWKRSCLVSPMMSITVDDIAPDLGLVKPFATKEDFNRYRQEDKIDASPVVAVVQEELAQVAG
jgi:hypothetical protein